MSDEATLRDVTVEPNPSVAEPKEPADAPAPVLDMKDSEAAEIGRIMLDSGYTKEKVNQVLEAPAALNSLRYLINNDPKEFLSLLERTDPATGEKFLESMASTYVDRYADKGAPASGKSGKGEGDAQLMAEVAALKEKITGFETKAQQQAHASAMAQVQARYDARVDDLLGQLPKDLGLTKSETKAMRAQLNQELAADPSVVQRVSNGNFVDVPRTFKNIVESWTSDRKAAADAAKSGRERSSSNAFSDLSSGPQPFMLDVPAGASDSWDATEEAFGKALERASR